MNIPTQLHSQIKEAWSAIDSRIVIQLIHSGESEHLEEFREFLNDAVKLNNQFSLEERIEKGESIHFKLVVDGEDKGIAFQGIPLGHELTSFVLAPLAASLKAKLPDERTIKRIRQIKGEFEFTSYVSLSCENCPIVVQALNILASLNINIKHKMVEGGMFQDEVGAKGILSVPTVYLNGEAFSTGRQDMSQILNKLEELVEDDDIEEIEETQKFDAVIVGSGPAGVSAAIYTARKGMKTAVVSENVGGMVAETKGIENMIATPYIEGPELSQGLRKHLESYPVEIFENQKVSDIIGGSYKKIKLKGGLSLESPIVIAATGARWRRLNVPGENEYIGRGVAFCPHCDGPFYKDKEIAVVGGGNSGVEAALDLAGICKKVTLFERGEQLRADKVLVDKLIAKNNIEIILNAETAEIKGDGQQVVSIEYNVDGIRKELAISGIFIQIGLVPNSDWISNQVETTEYGEILINEKCESSSEGIFAAGDVSTVPYKQIVVAMGEGAKAGLSAFEYYIKNVS